jgi:hypothetical protein
MHYADRLTTVPELRARGNGQPAAETSSILFGQLKGICQPAQVPNHNDLPIPLPLSPLSGMPHPKYHSGIGKPSRFFAPSIELDGAAS